MRIFKLAEEVSINGKKININQDLDVLLATGKFLKEVKWLPIGSAVLLNCTGKATRLGVVTGDNLMSIFSVSGEDLNMQESTIRTLNEYKEYDIEAVESTHAIVGYDMTEAIKQNLNKTRHTVVSSIPMGMANEPTITIKGELS